MILYLDTSALVKLLIVEQGTDAVREASARAEALATSLLTYAESRSALSRKRREGTLTDESHAELVRRFEGIWSECFVMHVDESRVRAAGLLSEVHGLRAFDAVHLSAALSLRNPDASLAFLTADRRLAQAAEAEGLRAP